MKAFRKYIKYVAVGLMAMAAAGYYSSCTDLDENPYTFIDPNSFYTSASDLDAALVNTYRAFRDMAGARRTYVCKLEVSTDQGEPNYRKEQPLLDNSCCWVDVNNATYTFSDLWADAYVVINDANIVLGRMSGVELTDDEAKQLEGQARFLRAYAFYHIVRIYGGCPIPLTYTDGVEGLEMARSSIDEVYDQIIEDLEYGAENLPKRGEDDYDVWRASQGACQALLGEVYLYKATIEASDNLSADTDLLQKSLNYSKAVIDSDVYSLVSDYRNQFYWFNADAKNNEESIFELQYSNESGQTNSMGIDFGIGNNSGLQGVCGTYYNRYGPTCEVYLSYDENDTRRDMILTEFTDINGDTYYYDTDDQVWLQADGVTPYTPESYAFHPLLNVKYYDRWADSETYRSQPGANFPMLRYAEVLLNYAEAANLLSAGNGLDQLNAVHTRAGLDAYSSMSQQEMDNAIIQERDWEFVGECKAYYDQLRKGVLGDRTEEFVYNNYLIYLKDEYVIDGTSTSRKKLRFANKMQIKPDKDFLWKIPTTDLDSNSLLEQNPDNTSLSLNY